MKRCALTVSLVGAVLLVFMSLLDPIQAHDFAAPNDSGIGDAIRVGVITQQDGPHLGIYFPAIANCSSVSSVAVADASGTTFQSAERMLGKLADFKPYRDPAAMIREFRPNLVIVSLAAHRAPAQIQEALSAGCHVLAEKPACVRPEDFRPLVKLARDKKRNLMLALPSRLAPDTLRAKEIVDAGWIGKPYGVTFFQVKDQTRLTRPDYQKSWLASADKAGGGHLIWLGIHNLDQVFFIANDRVEKVTGFSNNVGGQPVKIEDAEGVVFRFRSGMIGTFHGGYYLEGGSTQAGTTLWGSRGWIRMSSSRGPDGSNRAFQWYSTHQDAPRGIQTEQEKDGVNAYQLLVQAAIDSARGARPAPLDGDDCLHVLEVIFGAYRAAETGTSQTIATSSFKPPSRLRERVGVSAPAAEPAASNSLLITDFETNDPIDELETAQRPRAAFRQTGYEDFPTMVTDGQGQVWLAVVSRPVPDREVRIYRVAPGGRRLAATLRPTELTGIGSPALAPLPNGCLVAFAVEQADRWRVAVTQVNDEATETEFQYINAGGTANVEPSIVRSGGHSAVVWESNAGGLRGIFAAWLTEDGVATPRRISSPEFVSLNPAVTATEDGSLFAVWDSVRGKESDLYGAWYRDGQWQPEHRLTDDPRLERFASLATNGTDVWLAWQAQTFDNDRVTHLDGQQAVVAKIQQGGQLVAPKHLFDEVAPANHLLLRPKLTFDPQGRLWLTVRRSLFGVIPETGRRPVGRHSGWEPLLWCYADDHWAGPSRLTETPGRWRPIPVAWTRHGRGIAAVQRDNYPAGWGIDTGIADDWACDVRLVTFDASALPAPELLKTVPLRMPPTDFRLAQRIEHSSADFPRQTAVVAGKQLRLYWGDLHDHTDLSVCVRASNPPIRENYNTKRDIERLDFTAITDHGYNLDHPQWQWSAEQVRANYDPGKFVTLLGEEWTSDHVSYIPKRTVPMIGTGASVELRRYGHHNIIFRDPYYKEFYDSRDRDETPEEVWEKFEDDQAFMIPHQLADLGNRPTDWLYHDEWRQPLAEIFQTRGSYEHLGCEQQAIRSMAVRGHFMQDAWERGHVIGVIASPDHGGGRGKAGVWAERLTRDSLFEAFHDRHTFGTTGAKLGLLVTSGDHMMGDKVLRQGDSPVALRVRVVADRKIEKLVVLRNNEIVHTVESAKHELRLDWSDPAAPGNTRLWYYVRLHLSDDHLAWSSPIWFLPAIGN